MCNGEARGDEAVRVLLKDTWLMTLFQRVMKSDCPVQESKHLVKLDQNHSQVRQGETVQISSARSEQARERASK